MSGLFGNMFDEGPPPRREEQPATRKHDYSKQAYSMPFGKHKSVPVMDLPLDYLIWLWFKRDGEPLRDPLAGCVRKALESYNVDPDGEAPQQSR